MNENSVRGIGRIPEGFDWNRWIERWDRMQERYLVARDQRFERMVSVIRATQRDVRRILDVGCGPGSLTAFAATAFPDAEIVGVDFDPSLLLLARKRFERGSRITLLECDVRHAGWSRQVGGDFSAIVSSTALHWLSPPNLEALYRELFGLLAPGGVFLNADHAANSNRALQAAWERERQDLLEPVRGNEDWEAFWREYAAALDWSHEQFQSELRPYQDSVEEGMPLQWHFEKLRDAGFEAVECFWRCTCDAIYGGFRPGGTHR
jgi:trans-aconitate methyltransferase